MRGMGKTTVIKNVFNVERVKKRFEIRIWVTVSQPFDIVQILTGILERATNRTVESTLELELLARRTRDSLKGKLFLIVLDDMWDIEDSEKLLKLESSLRPSAKGSKIIVTTRSMQVPRFTGTILPYVLGILSDEQSWLLFEKLAFGQEPKSAYKMQVGKEMVKRCGGHPLCVKTIASMLRSESSEAEWRMFYENEFARMGSDNNDILPLLVLCYARLPSHLKHCFAYCSLFPKDYEFDVQTLIKLWMAQGFIEPPTQGQSLEDVGYEYLLDLLGRSFFEEATKDVRGRVEKLQMHSLMHDLSLHAAGKHSAILNSDTARHSTHGRTSHVSIDNFEWLSAEDVQQFPAEKLRSIVFLGQSKGRYDGIPGNKIFEIITFRFRFLRALDMHALGITSVPHSIGKLKLLKYLDLSENEDIMELPNSITKLLNLQTLRLSSCFRLKKLPRGLKNLVNLRHLEIDGCYNLTSLPKGIIQLPDLQMLSQLVASEGASPNIGLDKSRQEVRIRNLGRRKDDMKNYLTIVKEVRSLTLEWESHARESDEDSVRNINSLLALEELTLHGFRGESLRFQRYPSTLVKLSLWRCLDCQALSALDQLLHLKVLVLDEVTELEYISDNASSRKIFPSLQELWLTELPKLHCWWRNGDNDDSLPSFACLSKLVIEDCPNLASMPLFPTLEEGLVLDNTSWGPFQRTLNQKTALQEEPSSSSTSPSSLPPLSKLRALRIVVIADFKADEITWDALKSLQFLRLDCLPNLEFLPEQLQQVTSLQELHLWRCGIKEIPEWIGKLQNLEKLVIRVCPLLKSVPEAIRQLLLLETLEIEECNMLLRRCEKDIGADWEKITFIRKPLLGRIYGR